MPIPDILFSVIGVADFLVLLLIVAATGFITRKKEHAAENTSAAESGKKGETKLEAIPTNQSAAPHAWCTKSLMLLALQGSTRTR